MLQFPVCSLDQGDEFRSKSNPAYYNYVKQFIDDLRIKVQLVKNPLNAQIFYSAKIIRTAPLHNDAIFFAFMHELGHHYTMSVYEENNLTYLYKIYGYSTELLNVLIGIEQKAWKWAERQLNRINCWNDRAELIKKLMLSSYTNDGFIRENYYFVNELFGGNFVDIRTGLLNRVD
jgi:hypothetical protein